MPRVRRAWPCVPEILAVRTEQGRVRMMVERSAVPTITRADADDGGRLSFLDQAADGRMWNKPPRFMVHLAMRNVERHRLAE